MKTVKDFVGEKASYDPDGQVIFGEKGENLQLLLDVRGWGAIQNLFKEDEDEARKFQDELGEWVADAINQKLSGNVPLEDVKEIKKEQP